MPGFDGTGPVGNGPTGGGRGACNGNTAPQGRFFGRGRGWGRGICRFFFGQQNNAVSLDEEEKMLTQRLDAIRKAKENESQK